MPSTPKQLKMFFCRVTAPLNEDLMAKLPRFIKTKHYVHYFSEFYYVHETGCKTEKPHYHLLILCKTTKIEIQKYIKYNWNIVNFDDDTAKGNAVFAVSDRYLPESKDLSLAYMLKGGLNKIYEDNLYNNGWVLCPHDCDGEIYIQTPKYEELIELYKLKLNTELKDKTKFDYYYELIKYEINKSYIHKDCYIELLKFIYHVLIQDEIKKRKCIKRYNLWDWSFTLTLHFVTYHEQVKLIEKTINDQIRKNLDILD